MWSFLYRESPALLKMKHRKALRRRIQQFPIFLVCLFRFLRKNLSCFTEKGKRKTTRGDVKYFHYSRRTWRTTYLSTSPSNLFSLKIFCMMFFVETRNRALFSDWNLSPLLFYNSSLSAGMNGIFFVFFFHRPLSRMFG